MKIRFLSGPLKGTEKHVAKNDPNVGLLIGAGLVEEVPNSAGPANPGPHDVSVPFLSEPVWGFVRLPFTDRPAIRKTFASSEQQTYANYEGTASAEDVVAAARKAGAPENIVSRYIDEMKKFEGKALANEQQRNQIAQANGGKSPFIKVGWD